MALHRHAESGTAGAAPSFQAVPPVSSRLAAAGATGAGAEGASNPWGNFGASVSARSRQRLKDRTGM